MFYSLTLTPTLYDLTLAGESQSPSHIKNLEYANTSWYRSFSYLLCYRNCVWQKSKCKGVTSGKETSIIKVYTNYQKHFDGKTQIFIT